MRTSYIHRGRPCTLYLVRSFLKGPPRNKLTYLQQNATHEYKSYTKNVRFCLSIHLWIDTFAKFHTDTMREPIIPMIHFLTILLFGSSEAIAWF